MVMNNRKGYMLIEIILAFAIAFGISYFMIDMTIKLKNKNDDILVETLTSTDQTIITNKVMKFVKDKGASFNCSKLTTTTSKKNIYYDGTLITVINDYATIGNITCTTTTISGSTAKYYNIIIPIKTNVTSVTFNVNVSEYIRPSVTVTAPPSSGGGGGGGSTSTTSGNAVFVLMRNGTNYTNYRILKYAYNGSNWAPSTVSTSTSSNFVATKGDANTIYTRTGSRTSFVLTRYTYNGSTWTSNNITTQTTSFTPAGASANTVYVGMNSGKGYMVVDKYKYRGTGTTWIVETAVNRNTATLTPIGGDDATVFVKRQVNNRYYLDHYKYTGSDWVQTVIISNSTSNFEATAADGNTVYVKTVNGLTYTCTRYSYDGRNWPHENVFSGKNFNYTISAGDSTTLYALDSSSGTLYKYTKGSTRWDRSTVIHNNTNLLDIVT